MIFTPITRAHYLFLQLNSFAFLICISYPTQSTFPVGGNRSGRRKPTTFGGALTYSFHMSVMIEVLSEDRTQDSEVKAACSDDCAMRRSVPPPRIGTLSKRNGNVNGKNLLTFSQDGKMCCFSPCACVLQRGFL